MTYDCNPLRVPTNPNHPSYAGVFIAVQWSPRRPPTWVSAHLRRQVDAGLITWRFAMIAQARMKALEKV